MGGEGSGTWFRADRKSTVEESLTLAMADFRGRLKHRSSGTLTWRLPGGHRSSISYLVTWGDTPTVTLHYRGQDEKDVLIAVQLQSTPTQFGGLRWWFTCPLTTNGLACNRRAGKLYLPPGQRYFGCRKCHDLTYRGCQESHQTERLLAQLGVAPGYEAAIARLLKSSST